MGPAPEFVTELVTWGPASQGSGTQIQISAPVPVTLRLRSQQFPIRGVSIDAEFAPASLTVYNGTSANGFGYQVAPGTARAFGVEDSSALFVTFNPSSTAGYARLTAYSFPVVAYGIATGAAAIAQLQANVKELSTTIRHLATEIRKLRRIV